MLKSFEQMPKDLTFTHIRHTEGKVATMLFKYGKVVRDEMKIEKQENHSKKPFTHAQLHDAVEAV